MDDKHDKDVPFEGRTYLMIRDHPADDGSEPLISGVPHWLSPDIVVVQEDGTRGGEAVVGKTNRVEVTVRNLGGVDATGVYVDVFFGHAATGFTPATAALIGGTYIDVPGYGNAVAALDWVPPSSYSGHGCLLARCSLIVPLDTYDDPSVFAVRADRHVAQRNLTVIDLSESNSSADFMFNAINLLDRPMTAFIEVRELRGDDVERALQAVIGGIKIAVARERLKLFTLQESGQRTKARMQEIKFLGRRKRSFRLFQPEFTNLAVLGQDIPMSTIVRPRKQQRQLTCKLEEGDVCQMMLHIERNPDARPGEVHVLEVRQLDEKEQLIGGLTVVARN